MLVLTTDDKSCDLDSRLIGELVFWNFNFDMLKFHDYRKILNLNAHSLKILRHVIKDETNESKTTQDSTD